KAEGRALRIGTNHGSLSQRMVQRYGDSPRGMVESALEYIRFCEEARFHQIVLSMKASNVKVMIYAYRELVERMRELEMAYPIHLGVTEAGGGIEGILKSAQGIGALLEDGIGDTVRVSLTDPPEMELGPARALASLFSGRGEGPRLAYPEAGLGYTSWSPRETHLSADRSHRWSCGGAATFPVTLMSNAQDVPGVSEMDERLPQPDSRIPADRGEQGLEGNLTLFNSDQVKDGVVRRIIPVEVIHDDVSSWTEMADSVDEILQFHLTTQDLPQLNSLVDYIHHHFKAGRTLLSISGPDLVHRYRLLDLALRRLNCKMPVDLLVTRDLCRDPLALASQLGALLGDGIGNSLTIMGDVAMTGSRLFAFTVLQGSGTRIFSTEFVSCPSCGRTLFDLEETSRAIRARTSHLKGLKIGIMGCIVNGPGEMADADFGYVGSAAGRVDLYVGQDIVKKNIPAPQAVDELVSLIREHGKWVDAEPAPVVAPV
ncbi:MAG: (E)-4-hydroxy-3-methylbut-2-enyl-diphosphate synthase, partial [Calditrichaeota bacterium]|nr:(E)-4-hydroxy-3-methylbut-2-enyl-diphosphate synthase [Calditrichota bacterium]